VKFVVIDIDAGVPLADRVAYAAAQQRQLREHFAPLWDGLGDQDEVRAATPATPPLAGEVQIRLYANAPANEQGALGVHDRLPDGTPVANVFVALAKQYGDAWTSVASHEVLEVRGDPRLHACIDLDDGTIWDREIADRVEGDTYQIDKVILSNFNTPDAFEPSGAAGDQFDYLHLSKKANEVRPGGYAQKFDLAKGWTMVGAMRGYRSAVAAAGLGRPHRRAARGLRRPASLMRRLLRALHIAR
jgi:hypothetical protein